MKYKLIVDKKEIGFWNKVLMVDTITQYSNRFKDLQYFYNANDFWNVNSDENFITMFYESIKKGLYVNDKEFVRCNEHGYFESISKDDWNNLLDKYIDEIIDEYIFLLECEQESELLEIFKEI